MLYDILSVVVVGLFVVLAAIPILVLMWASRDRDCPRWRVVEQRRLEDKTHATR